MSVAERWRLRVFEFVDAPGVNARVFADFDVPVGDLAGASPDFRHSRDG